MARAQRALQWRELQSAEQQQQEVLDALSQVRDDLQQARANLAETEDVPPEYRRLVNRYYESLAK